MIVCGHECDCHIVLAPFLRKLNILTQVDLKGNDVTLCMKGMRDEDMKEIILQLISEELFH